MTSSVCTTIWIVREVFYGARHFCQCVTRLVRVGILYGSRLDNRWYGAIDLAEDFTDDPSRGHLDGNFFYNRLAPLAPISTARLDMLNAQSL